MTFNKTWFESHKTELEPLYLNKYVTVYNGTIIDSGKNLSKLINDFVTEYGEVDVYFGYVGDMEPINLPMSILYNTTADEPSIGETK